MSAAAVVAASVVGLSCSDDEPDPAADAGAGGAPSCGDSPGAKCCETKPNCRVGLACNAAKVCEGCGDPDELCCDGACSLPDHTCQAGRCVACGDRGQPCCAGACSGAAAKCCVESADPKLCEPTASDGICKVCCADCVDGTSSAVNATNGDCAAAAAARCEATALCPDGGVCTKLKDYSWKTGCQ